MSDQSNPLISMFANAVADNLQGMQETQEQFHAEWGEDQQQLHQAFSQAASRLSTRHTPFSWREDVKAVAMKLQAFPQVVPIVDALIDRYVREIAAETQKVNAKFEKIATNANGSNGANGKQS